MRDQIANQIGEYSWKNVVRLSRNAANYLIIPFSQFFYKIIYNCIGTII